jgi:hypothetical protein
MITKLTDLQRLSYDAYTGNVVKYSKEEAENAIRKAITEACGGDWNFYNFQKNKWDVYAVLTELLSITMGDLITDKFNSFVDVQDTNLGDTIEFLIEDNSLFRIATIADGNTDIRRQKLYGKKLTVTTEKLAVKIYAELDQFLAGRINWGKMLDRVTLSYAFELTVRIYNCIYNSYASLNAPFAQTGSFSEDTLATMIADVQMSTGQTVVVYGTKKALGKITNTTPSERMKDELNMMGHYGYFQGTALIELPQGKKAGTQTNLVNDSFLLVIPAGEKIVKMILEGDAYIYDTPAGVRNDEQIEFFFGRKAGVSALITNQYGMYKLS